MFAFILFQLHLEQDDSKWQELIFGSAFYSSSVNITAISAYLPTAANGFKEIEIYSISGKDQFKSCIFKHC